MRKSKWEEITSNIKTPHQSAEAATFNYLANISLKYDYLYVETPKVCCSSIKNTLMNAELGYQLEFENFEDLHVRHWSPLIDPARVGDFNRFLSVCKFKFCFVRNPYTRLLSSFLDKIVPKNGWHRDVVSKFYGKDADADISFEEFVEFVYHQDHSSMDPHWRMQSDLLCTKDIKYDFIGRFERFEEDFGHVLHSAGIDPQLYYKREARHATAADQKLDAYYTEEAKKKVFSKFFFDFDNYGYER